MTRLQEAGALVAVTIIGLILRVAHIDRWPLWSDEALTLVVSEWPTFNLFVSPVDPSPGLYYFLSKILIGSDAGAVAARSISLVAGIILIPATYAAARLAKGNALLAAALVALSFPLIDYSQEARAYELLVLIVTLAFVSFMRFGQTESKVSLAAFVLLSVLAIYTHTVGWLWTLPASAGLFVLSKDKRTATIGIGALIVLTGPELSRMIHLSPTMFTWLPHVSAATALSTIGWAFFPLGLTGEPSELVPTLLMFAVVFTAAYLRRNALIDLARSNPFAMVGLIILCLIPFALWLISFLKPVFMHRTIIVAIPGFFILISILVGRSWPPFFALITLFAASLMVTGTVRDKEDWRSIRPLLSGIQPGDAIIVCPYWRAAAVRHVIGRYPARLYGTDGEHIELIETSIGSGQGWSIYRKAIAGIAPQRSAPVVGRRFWTIRYHCDAPAERLHARAQQGR